MADPKPDLESRAPGRGGPPKGGDRPTPGSPGDGSTAATSRAALALQADGFAPALFESIRVPLLVLDAELRVVTTNPAFRDDYGLPVGEVVGRPFFEIGEGAWEVAELRAALEGLTTGPGIDGLEVRIDIPGSGPRIVSVDGRRIHLEAEEVDLVFLALDDVTERERYEERLERYARELERSNRELESFAHAASHDLQEPLRKIRTYVGRITVALGAETLDERVRGYLERMPEAVERMQLRIDDLLQLARLGRADPVRSPTDLEQVVERVLEDLEVAVAESGARIEVGELPTVQADPEQMRLLFQNLISNGIKFAEEGERPVVRIGAEDLAAPHFRIVVEDEGIGFEQKYAERIFAPFQRLHGRHSYPSSGVGLAICRTIVEKHDGTITAEGRTGVGARFTVHLPSTTLPEDPA